MDSVDGVAVADFLFFVAGQPGRYDKEGYFFRADGLGRPLDK